MVGRSEERAPEAPGDSNGGEEEKAPETSSVRLPLSDLGKAGCRRGAAEVGDIGGLYW